MALFFSFRCYNGGLKHNFQPRFSIESGEQIPKGTDLQTILKDAPSWDVEEILLSATTNSEKKTYHGEVCTWCGAQLAPKKEQG